MTSAEWCQRNGHRAKTLTTTAGDLDLRIPKLRAGSFFPSLLERRRRIDRALSAVVMEAYLHGVSTRAVDDLVVAMGATSGISKLEVSRICQNLDEEVTSFRDRPPSHIAFPYIYLDATYCKTRVDHRTVAGRGHRHRYLRGRAARGARLRGRRQRGGGVLDRVPQAPASERPVRGQTADLRCPRGPAVPRSPR
jgi:hypothetical protein